jgi:hypothetical protein
MPTMAAKRRRSTHSLLHQAADHRHLPKTLNRTCEPITSAPEIDPTAFDAAAELKRLPQNTA